MIVRARLITWNAAWRQTMRVLEAQPLFPAQHAANGILVEKRSSRIAHRCPVNASFFQLARA